MCEEVDRDTGIRSIYEPHLHAGADVDQEGKEERKGKVRSKEGRGCWEKKGR